MEKWIKLEDIYRNVIPTLPSSRISNKQNLSMPETSMNPVKEAISKVRKTIFRHRMLNPGDLCIVAVSGGPDSVCLLDILHELKEELEISLVVAHFDHGLREAEDEAETQFVQRLASSMNLRFETEKSPSLIKGGTASVEEKARNARYQFLERLRDGLHAQRIAVGHNLNDQAETILMRLLRGSGPSGLAGIPPCRENTIIRPLIETEREEIESYLKARDLSYVIDSSNLQAHYLRNKIRLELLPLLQEYQPRLVGHLGHLADILRGENRYLEIQAEDWVMGEAELGSEGDLSIPIAPFVNLPQPVRNRVTREILKKIGKNLRRIDYGHIISVYELAQSKKPHGILNLPNGLTVKRTYDRLAFKIGVEQKPNEFHYRFDGTGTYLLEEIGRSICLVEMEPDVDLNVKNHEWIAYLDAEKLRFPLILRNFRAGDRFVPLGMGGHKKIKDFFIDHKIPAEMRALIPILVSHRTPVWICGYRIDDRYKITSKTKKILKVTVS